MDKNVREETEILSAIIIIVVESMMVEGNVMQREEGNWGWKQKLHYWLNNIQEKQWNRLGMMMTGES